MSAISDTFQWLIENKSTLPIADQLYLDVVAAKYPQGGYPLDVATRFVIIYTQAIKRAARGAAKEEPGVLTISAGNYRIKIPYGHSLKERVQLIKGAKWEPIDKVWSAPITSLSAVDVMQLVDDGRLTTSLPVRQETLAIIQREVNNRIKSRESESNFVLRPGFGSPIYTPRPFQLAGIEYGVGVGNVLFGDDMGLGKSIQMLGWAWHLKAFPLLIITKATLKYNIEKEAKQAYPWAKIVVCESDTELTRADVIIINYDLLAKGYEDKQRKRVKLSPIALRIIEHGYESIALDESHCISNKSQRTDACLKMGEEAKYKACMSGTAMNNRYLELVNQLKFLGHLSKFGGDWKFKQRYCGAKQVRHGKNETHWDFSGSSNGTELGNMLRSFCMVRRKKKEVATELPDKTRIDYPIQVSNLKEYNRAKADVLKAYSEYKAQEEEFQHTIRHLRGSEREAAIIAYRKKVEVKARYAQVLIKYQVLRQLTSQGKIAAVVDLVADLLADPEKKVIVFAYYKATQLALYEALKEFGAVTVFGEDSPQQRVANCDRFQADPNIRVIVVSISAGSDGLNLTAADEVIAAETCFVPMVMRQCEDRAHRIGQKKPVTARYFWGIGTIDYHIKDLLEDKTEIFTVAMDGEEGGLSESHSKRLLDQLFSELSSLS